MSSSAPPATPLAQDWVLPGHGTSHDIAIIGAGQSGIAIAAALKRAGVQRVVVFDAQPAPAQVGIWARTARMNRLRTPKELAGPEAQVDSLSYRSWFELQHGPQAYAALERIDRLSWAQYLRWFREEAGLEVHADTHVQALETDAGGVQLQVLDGQGKAASWRVRRVVLATGFLGSGELFVPQAISAGLPRQAWAHTSDAIDFSQYRGKKVAIIGAAASAFDAAGTALEQGAGEVRLLCRSPALATGTPWKNTGYEGYEHFFHLPDALKWQVLRALRQRATFPPAESVQRATRHAGFHLHLNTEVQAAHWRDGQALLTLNTGSWQADAVIAATGYQVDFARQPLLAAISERVQTWGERFQPQAGHSDPGLARFPYLGEHMQLLARGTDAGLSRIVCYNAAAMASHGRIIGDIPSMKYSVPLVVNGLVRALWLEDAERYVDRLINTPSPVELEPQVWASAVAEL
jgi:cation diffusion facilitator CzcD-associated flavoprotein CzcO